ncbi:flagellar motor switch protein FliN [Nocardioides sp. GCM10027113]|uniref:flagellar motor switch protein FliN n=1 Tax=unclassified Nocardioides TaxID=2615069 RepID=UPI0036084CD4
MTTDQAVDQAADQNVPEATDVTLAVGPHAERAVAAATAMVAVLPASEPLTVAPAQQGTEHVTQTFAGAAIAELDLAGQPRIAVLVAEDLVAALASSPLGGLDLAAATQPALDAAAAALGTTARAAKAVDLGLVVADLGGPFTVVPLVGSSFAAALLVPDAALAAAPAAQPEAAPTPAFPPPLAAGQPVAAQPAGVTSRGIEMLHGVDMEVTVELGRTRMTVRDLLALSPGAVLELDRAAGSPADLLVNGRLIARGEVVVIDEDFGLRVTEIVDDTAAG